MTKAERSALPVQLAIIQGALAGSVIVDIGQLGDATRRALDKLAAKGTLAKWRGRWYPIPGAPFGIGPLKSCWGLREWQEEFEGFEIEEGVR